MTEKQMRYIDSLEDFIFDFAIYGEPKKLSKDMLGVDWHKRYKEISHQQASDCIKYLQEQAHALGCYENISDFTDSYE